MVQLARMGVPSGLNRTYFADTDFRKQRRSWKIRLAPHSKRRMGGWGTWRSIDALVGFVQLRSDLTLVVMSASGSSQASNQISIWTPCGPAPWYSGLPDDRAPRAGGRFQLAALLVEISAGLYMKRSSPTGAPPSAGACGPPSTRRTACSSWPPPLSISA